MKQFIRIKDLAGGYFLLNISEVVFVISNPTNTKATVVFRGGIEPIVFNCNAKDLMSDLQKVEAGG